jgi:hypothetical protein
MFIAPEMDFLEEVLEMAQEGRRAKGKLADLEIYNRTLEKLPEERMVSLYLNYEELQDVYAEMMEEAYYELGAVSYQFPQIDAGFGMSLSVVDPGLQLDMVTVYEDPEEVPWVDIDLDLNGYEPQTPGMVPEETFLFYSNYTLPDQDKLLEDMLGEDYQEALGLLAEEIDVDLEEIYASLDGEIAVALFEQDEGFLGEVVGMPMGLSLLVGIKDDAQWDDLFDLLTEEAEYTPMVEIDDFNLDDFDLLSITMSDGYESYPVLVYGTGDEYAVLSTAVEDAEILVGDGDTLSDSEDFAQVWEAFPEETWPMMYVDMAGFVEWVENISGVSPMYGLGPDYDYGDEVEEEIDSASALEPLTTIAVGSSLYSSPDSQTVTMIFFIDR